MSKFLRDVWVSALMACWATTSAPAQNVDYQALEAFTKPGAVAAKVRNARLEPIWLPDGDRFWYRRQDEAGWSYVAIDPATATRSAAFDHGAMAAALSKTLGKPVDAQHLPLTKISFPAGSSQVMTAEIAGILVTCTLAEPACSQAPAPKFDDALAPSPDGRLVVFARDHNLWLRDLRSGKERALTHDGVEHFAYGRLPDTLLQRVTSEANGTTLPLYGVSWSPNSRHIVVSRTDNRQVKDYPFLQLLPKDGGQRPKVINVRSPMTGEGPAPVEVAIIDVTTGKMTRTPTLKGTMPFDWAGGTRALVLEGGSFARRVALKELDVTNGNIRTILTETSETFLMLSPLPYDEEAIRYLPKTNEVIWFSQRDGWNQLYLIDGATGAVKNKITDGAWNVQSIQHVDTEHRRLYFVGAGREAGEIPIGAISTA